MSTTPPSRTGTYRAAIRSRLNRGRAVLRRPTNALRPLPELLIIGAQRCGTTSLYEWLSQHPAVRAPLMKEPQYFSHRYSAGLGWYRALFPIRATEALAAGRVRTISFDATPYYLFHPCAPERAASLLPTARLVALLRDPAERAYSHYRHSQRLGHEHLPFEAALDAEEERLRGEETRIRSDANYPGFNHRHFSYVARGRYVAQLDRWLCYFDGPQLLVIKSEEMFAQPQQIYERVLGFLGLPAWQPPTFTAVTRSRPLTGPSELTDSVRERLARIFEEDNIALAERFGVDFRARIGGSPARA